MSHVDGSWFFKMAFRLLCWLALFGATFGWQGDASTAFAQSSVTYERVLELLELEVSEEKLFKLLKGQPTVFTLSDAQIARLKEAGASAKLLDAMQSKSISVLESNTCAYVMILDASGSMLEKASDGRSKWEVAKKSAGELIAFVPDGLAFGVVIYGHDRNKACGVEVLHPLAPLDASAKASLRQRIGRIKPVGKTPITKALNVAAEQIESANGLAKILLITDGLETCEGDPAQAAKQFANSAPRGRSVDVIGFALASDESAEVRKIAAGGKGDYFEAKSSEQLAIAFDKAAETMQALTKTAGMVKLSASKDMENPTAIEFGAYTKARLAMKNSHYWRVDFPAGKHVVVFDAEAADRAAAPTLIGEVELGRVEGDEWVGEAKALVSINEMRGRGVIEFELAAPATKSIKVTNVFTDIMDYHLGAFGSEDEFGVPFLANCPEIIDTELGKTASSRPLGAASPEFGLDRDAFFQMTLPAGDASLEVTWKGGAKDEFAMLRSVEACNRYGVQTQTLVSATVDKSAKVKVQPADEQQVILRVRGAAKGERVTVKLTPLAEDE